MESQLISYPGLQCDLWSKVPWTGLRGLPSGWLTIFQLAFAHQMLRKTLSACKNYNNHPDNQRVSADTKPKAH